MLFKKTITIVKIILKNYEFTKKNNVKLNKFQYENYKKPTRKKPTKN